MDAQVCLSEHNCQTNCDSYKLSESHNREDTPCESFLKPEDMQCAGDQAVLVKDMQSKDEQYENCKQGSCNLSDDERKRKQSEEINSADESVVENHSIQYVTQPETTLITEEDKCDQFELNNDRDQYHAADELVRKLCKNGKVMQFQDGEDFIKVVVYEDSGETEDQEDTLSAEEIERTNGESIITEDRNDSDTKHYSEKNLLECLLESNRENAQVTNASNSSPVCKRRKTSPTCRGQIYETVSDPNAQIIHQNGQWYDGIINSHAVTPANAIQSNFAQTMNQYAPGFLPCSLSDLDSAGKGGQAIYTPHPRNGYMLYTNDEIAVPENISRSTPLATSSPALRSHMPQTTPVCGKGSADQQSFRLNSSGEENISPTDIVDTPTCPQYQLQKKVRSLIQSTEFDVDDLGKLREQHNQKERKRRARIKEACNLLRQLVPGMSDKTDKATVFEFAARYVHFLKSHTGPQYDKDFLMKYSPY